MKIMDKELYREIDREHLAYIIKEINKDKEKPFKMANEELADEMFPYIQKEFPEAKIYKYDYYQFIVISKRGKNALIKRMKSLKEEHEKKIKQIDQLLSELK